MKKIILASALSSALILTGCGSSGSDEVAQFVADLEVTVSGKITNLNDTAEPGVVVEGIYSNPGDLLNPSITTDSSGIFSLDVLKNEAVYLRATKDTFASINSQKAALSSDVTDLDIGMPTETQAQLSIDAALGFNTTLLANKAWLVVEIVNVNDEQVNNITVTSNPAPAAWVYTLCDGKDSGLTVTNDAPCSGDRDGPMYLAYFDSPTEASVTVGNETQIAPIRMGEITGLEFEVSAIVAGQAKYDVDCASCHKAGSYDTSGSASDLSDKSSKLIPNLSTISGMSSVADLTSQEILDLTAFLDSL